ncbi:D-alanyl-D-alanine carboxypeptidase family protein [Rubrobacter indicoceani]|uniref:D-alanyl-D-alanine carboxypeptidase family protein n=1 Tax=Rubrobacter indicoceani TaxID=2051957 RepID=UPI000E5AB0E3|nr:D-alanyl-D-alanine carboxypeptidase family protein [Rubrobacter indicoceani]
MNFDALKRGLAGRFLPMLAVIMISLASAGVTTPAALGQSTTAAEAQYGGGRAGPDAGPGLPPEVEAPDIEARSWIIVDSESGETLAGENVEQQAPMASTTKIMTALVVLENAELDEEVSVSDLAASYAIPEYSNAGLQAGDVLSVEELLEAAIIVSGNDAAVALAEHVGGGGGERGVEEFVGLMNRKAEGLGLSETGFSNPTGLDARGHHSSARDLATLSRAAAESPVFREIVSTEYAVVSTQDREIPLSSVNELLYAYPAATGVKTGTSPGAGPSLVGSAAADGEDYTAVVLDAADRYGGMISILDYGFAAYDRRALVERDEEFREVQPPYRREESVPLVAARDIEALVGAESSVETRVEVREELPGSAGRGDRLGTVFLSVDGETVGESPLVASEGYRAASVLQKVGYTISRLWN